MIEKIKEKTETSRILIWTSIRYVSETFRMHTSKKISANTYKNEKKDKRNGQMKRKWVTDMEIQETSHVVAGNIIIKDTSLRYKEKSSS